MNGLQQEQPPPLRLADETRATQIMSQLSDLIVDDARMRRVARVFLDEMERGLRDEPSSLQMENTYVPELPNGSEEGRFLALDLGGTNFRVLLLELEAGQLKNENVQQYHIGDELRLGPGEDLFQFLAECVDDFVTTLGLRDAVVPLGFTFSFPMKQHSISSGELITWTKSFNCPGMEGVDVAELLQRCLRDRGLKVRVHVLLNDTTGTLVAGAQQDSAVGIAVILGTGSNGCYVERADRVQHWETDRFCANDVVVDIEWGAFGDDGCLDFIRTELDDEVDSHSLLVNSFTFEKYIGGKYLGEVLAAALRRLAKARLFPAAPLPHRLHTAQLSLFEEDNEADSWERTLSVLKEVCGEGSWSRDDALVAQHVARLVSTRAAQLVSVCISVLIRRMDREHVAVAIDGSVFKRHPRIAKVMKQYIELFAPGYSFTMMSAEDGSGKGSALTAAIAARLAERRSTAGS